METNVNLKYRITDIGPYVVYVGHNNFNVGRVHPMKLGGLLREIQRVKNEITEICRVGRNRLKIVLKTALAGNSLAREKLFSDNELTPYIPQHFTEKKNNARGVDTKLTESHLINLIESEVLVLDVRPMTRLVEQNGEKIKIPRQTIVVTFAGLSVPKAVTINYIKCPTEIYIPKVIQCLNCLRFGHISSQCNSKLRCKACGKEHAVESECSRVKFCVLRNFRSFVNSKRLPILSKTVCN
jgi:hypothetical protein